MKVDQTSESRVVIDGIVYTEEFFKAITQPGAVIEIKEVKDGAITVTRLHAVETFLEKSRKANLSEA